jgi:hypothetical protein
MLTGELLKGNETSLLPIIPGKSPETEIQIEDCERDERIFAAMA